MIIAKSKSSIITVITHILIWGIFGMILFFFQPLSWNVTIPYQLWVKQSIIFSLLVVAYYANALVFVPNFLLKNKRGLYWLCIIIAAAIIVLLNTYVDEWLNLRHLMEEAFHHAGPQKHHKGGPGGHRFDFGMTAAMMGTIALVLGVGTSITAIQKWQNDKQAHQEKEQERVSSELSFLKAQINPHFFFNTLNNIYALTHVDAEISRKAIHQLSRMMRYVLYDTQNATTMLSQEVAFIKDYISLMQLRLTNVVKIDFVTPTALTEMSIAPMIFLPFVENAFKHGVSATQPSEISIIVGQKDNQVELTVINTIIKEQTNNLEEGSGIGLNNTRRRLDLLYPGKHKLVINESPAENIYMVHLMLDLS